MRSAAGNVALLLLALCACRDDGELVPDYTILSPEGSRHLGPQYSPDGKKMAWWAPAADSAADLQLWVGNADLSEPVKLPVRGYNSQIAWSPDGTRIATTSTQWGWGQIVVVPVAGGEARQVTSGAGVAYAPAWFADGDRLAYFASAEGAPFTSFVVSTSTGVHAPAFPGEKRRYFAYPSPRGSHIAYNVYEGARATIWVADSVGRNPRQLTTEGFEWLPGSPWSPDGRELLYDSRRTGAADVWVVPIDGRPARQLTRDVRHDYPARWSPDGKWVSFISERGRQTDVWVVAAAGGRELRITDNPAQEYAPPIWRSGTNELAFVTEDVRSSVWALDLASGKERRLTEDSVRVGYFMVSPDGQQMLYVIVRSGGVEELAVMPVGGGPSRVILADGHRVTQPQWSPDGSKIVFESSRGGNSDIWVIDAAGGASRNLVNWPGWEYSPRWSGDGTAIYFISDRDARLGDVWKVSASGGEPTRVTRDGSVGNYIVTRAGVSDFFVGTINPAGGQAGYSRVRPDGSMNRVWERSNAFVDMMSPSGDSVTARVEQPGGKFRGMIISSSGGGGRVILKPDESFQWWSHDGSFIVYDMSVAGAKDLGLLRVSDGSTRRLTTTPEIESGAEMTPDGKTVVFRRAKVTQRIYSTDLSRILARVK